jgi:hypothetical protein
MTPNKRKLKNNFEIVEGILRYFTQKVKIQITFCTYKGN